MALSTTDILLKHVCPALGDVVALIMFASPLKAVLEVNRSKNLGELNPLPLMTMALNCFSWLIYGLYSRDFYIYIGNIPGLMFGTFYMLTCYKFSKEQAQDMLRNILLAFIAVFFAVGLVGLAAQLDTAAAKTMWGAVCVSILGIYYIAPLSSLAKVVAQRDSSSLHWPLCTMNIVNGMLWFAYGMALKDWFVGLPNGIGASFNVVCLVFCFIFPAKDRSRLAGDLNPAANWQVLRLQSMRNPVTGAPQYSKGGFFDLVQFRWRSGNERSFLQRLTSSSKFGSRNRMLPEQNSAGSISLPAAVLAAGAAAGNSPDTGTPDCKVHHLDVASNAPSVKGNGSSSDDEGRVRAAGDDVEQGKGERLAEADASRQQQ